MAKIFLTQETTFDLHTLLVEVENHLRDNEPHGELHTKVYDLLNEVERELKSYSYLQST